MFMRSSRASALSALLMGAAMLGISTSGGCQNGLPVDSPGSAAFVPSDTEAYPPGASHVSAAPAAAPVTGTAKISIDNFAFTPAEVTVAIGQPVIWDNHDDVPHNVVATGREFSSPALDTDQTYAHTFTARGTYTYFCGIHPHMTGRVIVK
jgi:plastocyanin